MSSIAVISVSVRVFSFDNVENFFAAENFAAADFNFVNLFDNRDVADVEMASIFEACVCTS